MPKMNRPSWILYSMVHTWLYDYDKKFRRKLNFSLFQLCPKKIITFKHFSGHEITVKSIQISSHHWISLQTKRKNYGNWYVCFCSNPSLYWKKYQAMAKFLSGFWTLVLNQGSFSLHYYVGTRNNSALNVRNQSYDGQIRLKCQNSGVLLSASSSRIFSQTPPCKISADQNKQKMTYAIRSLDCLGFTCVQ